jgi:hypothetical protein
MKTRNTRRALLSIIMGLAICGILYGSVTSMAVAQNPTADPDLNRDGVVNERDLLILVDQWHTGELFTPTPTETSFAPTNTPTVTPTTTFTPTYTPEPL